MPSPQACGIAMLNGCLFEHVEYTPTLGCPNFNSRRAVQEVLNITIQLISN
jgi:hypothetical protein